MPTLLWTTSIRPSRPFRLGDRGANVGVPADVGLQRERVAAGGADHRDRLLGRLEPQVGDGEARAFAGEGQGRPPDRCSGRLRHATSRRP
jgi:hypothetical protein